MSEERVVRRVGKLYGVLAVACATLCALPVAGASAAPLGSAVEFSKAGSEPRAIAPGPDGNLWFADKGTVKKIGQITPEGTITEFSEGGLPTEPVSIAPGPDGNMWFVDEATKKVGKIEPGTPHKITEFTMPSGSFPQKIAPGPDGNMWFADANHKIGMITPGGVVTEFIADTSGGFGPNSIVLGPNGNMWFTDPGNSTQAVGQITTTGTITKFTTPGAFLTAITPGTDGNLWYFDASTGEIGRVSTGGAVTEFPIPAGSGTESIAPGPDGNLWFADEGNNKIGRFGLGAPAASISAPSVIGSAQVGTQQVCGGDRWASWAGEQPALAAFTSATPPAVQWLRDGVPLAAPTGTKTAYTPVLADEGKTLSCTMTVTYPQPLNVTVPVTSAGVTVIAQSSGPTGATGLTGAAGAAGAAGKEGPGGKEGVAGAPGAQGAVGPQGPAGKDGQIQLVTCKTVVVKKKKKQKCTTRTVSSPVKFTTASARASLSRAGVVYATGTAGRRGVVLSARRVVRAGRYTLTLTYGQGRHTSTVRRQVRIA